MSEQTSNGARPRGRRTFSAFGEVRRMPTEYEIVTHGQNWTTRTARNAAFEQNPSSAPNLWFLTYRMYVNAQAESEHKVQGALEQYAAVGADAGLAPGWLQTLARLYTPSRYATHGFQQVRGRVRDRGPAAPGDHARLPDP